MHFLDLIWEWFDDFLVVIGCSVGSFDAADVKIVNHFNESFESALELGLKLSDRFFTCIIHFSELLVELNSNFHFKLFKDAHLALRFWHWSWRLLIILVTIAIFISVLYPFDFLRLVCICSLNLIEICNHNIHSLLRFANFTLHFLINPSFNFNNLFIDNWKLIGNLFIQPNVMRSDALFDSLHKSMPFKCFWWILPAWSEHQCFEFNNGAKLFH